MYHFRPKKFKKFHKKAINYKNGVIFRQRPTYGHFLIKSQDFFDFTVPQIMVCRSLITKVLKFENKKLMAKSHYINYLSGSISTKRAFDLLYSYQMPLFPDFTDTAKPKETRMGKGKGAVKLHFFPVKKGKILFELRNLDYSLARKCINLIRPKLPGRVKLVSRIY